jgi:alpha-beta hydrolase superfamily lysophospholipase
MHPEKGKEAGYRQWLIPDPKAVFVLVHGLGAHGGRWEAAADFFRKRGVSSYAVELGKTDSLADHKGKILRLHGIARRDNPAKKIFLIGESLGAITSFMLCAGRPGLFDALVCVSPAFSPGQRPSPPDYMRMLAALFFNPEKQFTLSFDSSMCTRDIEYRAKLDSDPDEYRAIPVKKIFEILLAQRRAASMGKSMLTPALFLIAGDDRIADAASAEAVFSKLAAKDKAMVKFPGMYHSLSIDLGREAVFEEILKWMETHL